MNCLYSSRTSRLTSGPSAPACPVCLWADKEAAGIWAMTVLPGLAESAEVPVLHAVLQRKRLNTNTAFVPPNPNELLIAASTQTSRG
jgi:hypothetical protein